MDRKSRATGAVYRDEAVDLVAAAARRERFVEPDTSSLARRDRVPPVRAEEPLSYPSPVGFNDNVDYGDTREVRQFSVARLVAWIVIAPWYLLVALASIGVDFLFLRTLLGF